MFKIKTTNDVKGIKRHGDKKHFHIARKGMRRAEALIERKGFFFFKVLIYDGKIIYNKTVTYPKMIFVINQVKNGKKEF